MRKRTRRCIAMVTLLGLLLFQASVAVHACAMAGYASGGTHHAMPAPDTGIDAHCAGMSDEAAAPTCFEHCNQGDNATATSTSHDAPAATAAFLVVATADEPGLGARTASTRPHEQTAAPPPLRLSHRLRI